jgi:hypothetical protein
MKLWYAIQDTRGRPQNRDKDPVQIKYLNTYRTCWMWEYSRREEEGSLFYVVYKQAYIHERYERTRKCMTWKGTVDVIEGTRKYKGSPIYLVNQEVPG